MCFKQIFWDTIVTIFSSEAKQITRSFLSLETIKLFYNTSYWRNKYLSVHFINYLSVVQWWDQPYQTIDIEKF